MKMQRALVAAVTVAAAMVFAAPAVARTIHVHPGQSIQAAIDRARPGDKIVVDPGTYPGNLTIQTSRLELDGAGPGATMIVPSVPPNPTDCIDPSDPVIQGICVLGGENDPVRRTEIDGFSVMGFDGFGVLLLFADDSTVSNTEASHNGEYGISGFVLSGVDFLGNSSHDNGDPGFYIGDSPHANARVIGNTSYNNGGGEGFGILLRDSSHGTVRDNRVFDNCAGIFFADTGENPDPVEHWRATNNFVAHNNLACPGEAGGPPPTSGLGIVLLGTHHVQVKRNTVVDHHPTGPSFVPGGIAVVSSAAVGGSDPMHNAVKNNSVHRNAPFDIFWDESGSGNSFSHNDCETSSPSWICSS